MSIEEIIKKMKLESKVMMLPKYYKSDVDSDFDVLVKYGVKSNYVWMLREAGSLLFPLQKGINPDYMKNYIQGDSTAHFYMIDNDNDSINEINRADACKLIEKEPINFKAVKTPAELARKIADVLSDTNITRTFFNESEIRSIKRKDWDNWASWFCLNNKLMAKAMKAAIMRYDELALNERRQQRINLTIR